MRGLLSILFKLPTYLRLAWRLMWDPRAPLIPKLFLAVIILYALSPFDLVPEAVLPHFGWGEDLLFLILGIRNLIQLSPPEIVTQHAKEIKEKS